MAIGKETHQVQATSSNTPPWVTTPCMRSTSLSNSAGCQVFMKLEQFQPSGSFKSRGVGNHVWRTVQNHMARCTQNALYEKVHFVSSSGGNAGLAATTAAVMLDQDITVIVPETTERLMRNKIIVAGGNVVVHGRDLPEASEFARLLVKEDLNSAYVPPFDHEYVWEGNATVVDELYQQLRGSPPDAIVCSVGGGGLLNGVMMGLERYGWEDLVTVVGMETRGADSLSQSVLAGQLLTIPKITSIATSLGVKRVSEQTWEWAKKENVHSVTLSDADAALGCVKLADDEKLIVEPACGVSVAACYHGILEDLVPGFNKDSKVVIIVCGGSCANAETIAKYRKQYGSEIVRGR